MRCCGALPSIPHAGIPWSFAKLGWDGPSGGWPAPGGSVPADYTVFGSGVMAISASSPAFINSCTVGTPCKIAITVYGFSAGQYSITAATDTSTKVRACALQCMCLVVTHTCQPTPLVLRPRRQILVASTPVVGYVPQGRYEYYQFTTAFAGAPLQIILTSGIGDPDIFVSVVNPLPSGACVRLAAPCDGDVHASPTVTLGRRHQQHVVRPGAGQ